MEKRIALIGIIVEDRDSVEKLNAILHDAAEFVIGRMGIPYREKNLNIMSIVVDAPMDVTSAISGRIGALRGVSAKTVYSSVETNL